MTDKEIKKKYPTIADICKQLNIDEVKFKVINIELLLRGDNHKPFSSIVTIEIFSTFIGEKEKSVNGPAYTVEIITGAELEVGKNYSTETGYIRLIP